MPEESYAVASVNGEKNDIFGRWTGELNGVAAITSQSRLGPRHGKRRWDRHAAGKAPSRLLIKAEMLRSL